MIDNCTAEFIENYRAAAIDRIFEMDTFAKCWHIWDSEVRRQTGGLTDAQAIYDIGSELARIFKLTASEARDQSSLAGGGAAWEGLVCWYLNLVLSGTRAVAIKQVRTLMPKSIADAATVTYGSYPTNTESDLSIVVFPEHASVNSSQFSIDVVDSVFRANFGDCQLHIVQCKTNWNDNAQIPMLWDMIYSATGFRDARVKIGSNGYAINRLRKFTYSFVTVPSQNKPIKAGSMATHRVSQLSGGNFWGRPSKNGVALSISEFFDRNLGELFSTNIIAHIRQRVDGANGLFAAR